MMQITSKSGMNSLLLISFIFLCSVLTSENAYSRRYWQKENFKISYNRSENTITFDFLFYDYYCTDAKNPGYLHNCNFYYSEDKKIYIHLLNAATKYQMNMDRTWLCMSIKKPEEKIILNCYKPRNGIIWEENTQKYLVMVNPQNKRIKVGQTYVDTKRSYMRVKWELPQSGLQIKSINIYGYWLIDAELTLEKINDFYTPENVNTNSYNLINAPSVSESERSNQVTVTVETDALTVTGAQPGETIKVYSVTGTEVKSVVATNNVVNIGLPSNQIYLVKAGQDRFKVAL